MQGAPAACRALAHLMEKMQGQGSLEREREIHYIYSSHLRTDQMCRGFFVDTRQ